MEASAGLGLLGVVLSGVAGCLVSRAAYAQHQRRKRTRALLGTDGANSSGGALKRWVARGVPVLGPPARLLLHIAVVRRCAQEGALSLKERGFATDSTALVTVVLAAASMCVAAAWVVTGSPVFGVAIAGGAVAAGCNVAHADADKRSGAIRDEIPDALRSLGVCFKAGLSLMQTLRQTGSELKGPLGALFLASSRLLETGGTVTEALSVFQGRTGTPELAFVAVALNVQHQAGGSIAHVLDAARESVEGEIELARSLRVQTAQAKLSARIVTLMPFALVALFSLMSPGFLAPFFESVPGMLLLGVALAMQIAGVVLVRRMLDIEDR